MIRYSYGILPEQEEFDRCFERECPDGIFEVRNDVIYGSTSFSCSELWDEIVTNLDLWEHDWGDMYGKWCSDVLYCLGIEWI
jgi:hypothetical protein